MSARDRRVVIVAANDNGKAHKCLRVDLDFPPFLPVQITEVGVIAQLLDSLGELVANANGKEPS